MVQIPTKQSTGSLSTQTTANKITDISSFTRNSAAIQKAGIVLGNVAEEFKQLDNLRQVTSATSGYNREIAEAESKFLNDPELSEKSIVAFQQVESEIRQRHLGSIGDETSRLKAGLSLEGTGLVKSFNIKRQGRQADLDNAAIENVEITSGFVSDYVSAGPTERKIVRDNFIIHQNNRLAARLATKKSNAEDLATFDETVRVGRARFWLEGLTAPGEGKTEEDRIAGANKFIEMANDGEYAELDVKEVTAMVNEAENFIKRHTEIAKDEREKKHKENFAKDSDDILDEKISLEEMERLQVFEDKYSKEKVDQVKGYFKDFKSPRPEGDENIQVWARLRKIDMGRIEKSVFVDADGNEVELSQEIIDSGKVPDGVTVVQRRFTSDEYEAEVMASINGNLSTVTAKRLLNNRYGSIEKKADTAYTQEFNNLEERMTAVRLRQFNEVEGTNVTETPAEVQAQIDNWTFIFEKRVAELDNPTREQISEIAEEVFNEWKITPVSKSGMGLPKNDKEIIFSINSVVQRTLTGTTDEEKPDFILK